MMRFWIVPAMVVALVGLSTPSAAQWTQIGPDGGRVIDASTIPSPVTTSYAATPAGLYRTTDGGDHWTLLGAGLFLNSPAISATNPSVLYAAGRLLRPRPRRRLQSSDGGASWAKVLVTIPAPGAWCRWRSIRRIRPSCTGPRPRRAVQDDRRRATLGPQRHRDRRQRPHPLRIVRLTSSPFDPQAPSTCTRARSARVSGRARTRARPGRRAMPALTHADVADVRPVRPANPSTMYTLSGGMKKSVDGGATWTPAAHPSGFPPALRSGRWRSIRRHRPRSTSGKGRPRAPVASMLASTAAITGRRRAVRIPRRDIAVPDGRRAAGGERDRSARCSRAACIEHRRRRDVLAGQHRHLGLRRDGGRCGGDRLHGRAIPVSIGRPTAARRWTGPARWPRGINLLVHDIAVDPHEPVDRSTARPETR